MDLIITPLNVPSNKAHLECIKSKFSGRCINKQMREHQNKVNNHSKAIFGILQWEAYNSCQWFSIKKFRLKYTNKFSNKFLGLTVYYNKTIDSVAFLCLAYNFDGLAQWSRDNKYSREEHQIHWMRLSLEYRWWHWSRFKITETNVVWTVRKQGFHSSHESGIFFTTSRVTSLLSCKVQDYTMQDCSTPLTPQRLS